MCVPRSLPGEYCNRLPERCLIGALCPPNDARLRVLQHFDLRAPIAINTRLERQKSLSHRWQHRVCRNSLVDPVRQPQSIEPRTGQDHRVECIALEPAEPRWYVSSQRDELQIGTMGTQ